MGRKDGFEGPEAAIEAARGRLRAVEMERVPLAAAVGRVLGEDVRADRDSPACDVSAMDGYAVRVRDVRAGETVAVAAEVRVGSAAPAMPEVGVVKLMTGGAVPAGAEAVVRREDVDESDAQAIRFRIGVEAVRPGQHIRRRGENLAGGAQVVGRGALITPAVAAALAYFGVSQVTVHRRVRVGLLMTGDELLEVDAQPAPWQVRDSNGPALAALLASVAWLEVVASRRAADDPALLRRQMEQLLGVCDAVVTSGGVSMGDRDFVPQVAGELGAQTVFHKLPVRPGKPIFVAVGPGGKLIAGLPGNPVSALVGATRIVAPLLRTLAGRGQWAPPRERVSLANADDATLGLWWWRLVRLEEAGVARLVETRGSGDLVSAARSDGFVEVPPGRSGAGPWTMYRWEIA